MASNLISSILEASFHTRTGGGVEKIVGMLNQLKSMSLTPEDILHRFSDPISELESLRRHRNATIRHEADSLFVSWMITLYAQGRRSDESLTTKKQPTKITTKTLKPPPRRKILAAAAPCKTAAPAKDCGNPNSVAEMVELFEAAKKAADVANAKGILVGKADASRCVEAISQLMKSNAVPNYPNDPRRIMQRLVGLARHKDRTICKAASSLLQLWRQRIREQQQRKVVSAITNNPPRPTCGHRFTRESTKAMNLVM